MAAVFCGRNFSGASCYSAASARKKKERKRKKRKWHEFCLNDERNTPLKNLLHGIDYENTAAVSSKMARERGLTRKLLVGFPALPHVTWRSQLTGTPSATPFIMPRVLPKIPRNSEIVNTFPIERMVRATLLSRKQQKVSDARWPLNCRKPLERQSGYL